MPKLLPYLGLLTWLMWPGVGTAQAEPDPVQQLWERALAASQANDPSPAIPMLEAIVTHHRTHKAAWPAAQLLLDALNRTQNVTSMEHWVTQLLADNAFLKANPAAPEHLSLLDVQVTRHRAESLEQATRYVEAAELLLAAAARHPSHAARDELLYNAAQLLRAADELERALEVFRQLLGEHPRSRLASRTLMLVAEIADRTGYKLDAARSWEKFATSYPGEPEAPSALAQAIARWHEFGHHRRARQLTDDFLRLYARRKPRAAAEVVMSSVDSYPTSDRRAAIRTLDRYLKRWGSKLPSHYQVIAYAKLGELRWLSSCPGGGDATGSCVRTVKPPGDRCSDAPALRPVARNRSQVTQARRALALAVKLADKLPPPTEEPLGTTDAQLVMRAHHAAAQAQFYLAEQDYEDFLGLQWPKRLDFDTSHPTVAQASSKLFTHWLTTKKAAVNRLAGPGGAYSQLASAAHTRSQRLAAAAAARVAAIYRAFALELTTAEIPRSLLRRPYADEGRMAFCDAVGDLSEPLRASATAAEQRCRELLSEYPDNFTATWCPEP